jgi:hypothetical protein
MGDERGWVSLHLLVRPDHLDPSKGRSHIVGMRLESALLILVSGCASSGTPQVPRTLVTGSVTDTAGRPIAFARVSAVGTTYAAQTDVRGRYAFDSLPADPTTLRAEFSGYHPAHRTGIRVRRGDSIRVDFRLKPREFPQDSLIMTEQVPSRSR